MPRVPTGAAIVFALVFASAAIGAATLLSLVSTAPVVEIGGTVQVDAIYPGGDGLTVHLFASTGTGTTVVTVNGQKVVLPVGGVVFEAGTGVIANGALTIDASVPNDPSLIGEKICWVAVIVDNVTGRIIAIARTGGPIIEDAIC